MMTPKLLTCDEGQIAVLSMYKEKQLDLNKNTSSANKQILSFVAIHPSKS